MPIAISRKREIHLLTQTATMYILFVNVGECDVGRGSFRVLWPQQCCIMECKFWWAQYFSIRCPWNMRAQSPPLIGAIHTSRTWLVLHGDCGAPELYLPTALAVSLTWKEEFISWKEWRRSWKQRQAMPQLLIWPSRPFGQAKTPVLDLMSYVMSSVGQVKMQLSQKGIESVVPTKHWTLDLANPNNQLIFSAFACVACFQPVWAKTAYMMSLWPHLWNLACMVGGWGKNLACQKQSISCPWTTQPDNSTQRSRSLMPLWKYFSSTWKAELQPRFWLGKNFTPHQILYIKNAGYSF